MRRKRAFSGAGWEPVVGYCRAVRAGPLVFVSGTAPVAEAGGIACPGDAYGQARRCLEIIVAALRDVGARPADVVRTRLFVADASRWSEIGRAHREVFGDAPPAATMIEVKGFIDPAILVEIEADAVVPARTAAPPRTGARRGRAGARPRDAGRRRSGSPRGD